MSLVAQFDEAIAGAGGEWEGARLVVEIAQPPTMYDQQGTAKVAIQPRACLESTARVVVEHEGGGRFRMYVPRRGEADVRAALAQLDHAGASGVLEVSVTGPTSAATPEPKPPRPKVIGRLGSGEAVYEPDPAA